MRDDSAPHRTPRPDTAGSSRPLDSAARVRWNGYPFRVLRGTESAPEQRRGIQAPAASPAARASRRQGSTGVDLRAGAGVARREPASQAPAGRKAARTLWVRAGRRRPVAPVGGVRESLPGQTRTRRRIHMHVGLALLALAQVAVLGLIAWGLTSPTWQVRYVQVTGTQDATLAASIQKLPLTGCNIFRCDTDRQVRLVEALPAVASAQVHAAYPDGLIVVVAARQPALLWQARGQEMVIARDGTVLGSPGSDPAYARAALPEVVDDNGAAFGGRTPVAGAQLPPMLVEMADQLRSGMAAALGGGGWTLRYTADTGFVAMGSNGERIIFGTPNDAVSVVAASVSPAALGSTPGTATVDAGVRAQLAEVRSLDTLLARQGQQPSLIDVRWGTHPYYRSGA